MTTRRVLAAGAAAIMVAIGLMAVPATADATHTLVTLNFTGNGCDACVITPRQLIYASDNGGQEASWDGQPRKVRGDSVTFRVPTENTRGMYFYIDEPAFDSDGFYDAAPMVVFQYAGYQPGEWVERSQAVKASSASPCWAGTTEASVSLSVNVRKVRVEGVKMIGNKTTGGPTKVRLPLAWVAPTEKAFGGFVPADRGVVAANGDPGCGGTS